MLGADPVAPDHYGVDVLAAGELSIDEVAAWQVYERAVRSGAAEDVQAAAAALGVATSTTESPAAPQPAPPVQARFTTRTISGRYRGVRSGWQLELRLDVDGSNALGAVSGDFYRVVGGTTSYSGSFMADSVAVATNLQSATITGVFDATFTTAFNRFQITVPRVLQLQPRADATIQFLSPGNQTGARYVCQFESTHFRTVLLEEDRTPGVTQFAAYDSSQLPSGGPGRTLTVAAAYGEAGIEVLNTGSSDIVPESEAAQDARGSWSNAELHASMVSHFSLWENQPGWHVWLLHAQIHDIGDRLLGIMFDQEGRQRQGAASFYALQAGSTPSKLRSQLYTCVHELGHCFNLYHSFHKVHMTPPQPNRPNAMSWMNYPDRFPAGAAAFWSSFPFQFDREELFHLRHAFRDNIIMGGADFGSSGALRHGEPFRNTLQDDSGLRLELSAGGSFALGEPVSISLQLSALDRRGKRVNAQIHPNFGFVQVAVEKPNGQVVHHEPLLTHCIMDEEVVLDENRRSISTNAYIGYGRRGHYFDQTGIYRVRALYYAADGSAVLSNILSLRIRSPRSEADEEIADLYLGNAAGKLFTLLGSDAQELQGGNDDLALVQDKYPQHTLADYARVVLANNAARAFKQITPDNRLTVRPSSVDQVQSSLAPAGMVNLESATSRDHSNALLQQLQTRAMVKTYALAESEPSAMAAPESATGGGPGVASHVTTFCVAQTQEVAREFAGEAGAAVLEGGAGGDPAAAAAPKPRSRSTRKK